MSTPPQAASAFGREGISLIVPARRPLRPTVGRHRFPIRDLRAEPADEKTERLLAKDIEWLDTLYRQDLPLREFSMLLADDLVVQRGMIWHRGTPIEGTLPPKQAKEADRLALWTGRIDRRGKRIPRYEGLSAIVHSAGSRNYYHWTIEIMPRLFALREAMREGLVQPERILLFYDEPFGFVAQSIAALLPELAPLVQVVPDTMTRLDRCVFFIDATPDAPYENHKVHTSRFKTCTGFLSEGIDALLAASPRQGAGRALLISRADAPTRRLIDEKRVVRHLADLGVERVTLTGVPFATQMQMMADARLIIAPHGAGLTNTLYCRPGTAVIELNVPEFVKRCRSFADIAMYRGLAYALVVAEPMPSDNPEPDIALQGPRALKALRKLAEKLLAGPATSAQPDAEDGLS